MDAEIGNGVGASARAPLPAAVIAGDFAIDEVAHEPAFAVHPPDVEIFGEEHGGNHAETIVHGAGGEEFAHASIDDGEAGLAVGPAIEVVACGLRFGAPVAVPREMAVVGLEFVIEDIWVMPEDLEIELPPDEFVDESGDAWGMEWVAGGEVGALLVKFSGGDGTVAKVLREAGVEATDGLIAGGGVLEDGAIEKVFDSLAGGGFA